MENPISYQKTNMLNAMYAAHATKRNADQWPAVFAKLFNRNEAGTILL
jgi:hypothetical protein